MMEMMMEMMTKTMNDDNQYHKWFIISMTIISFQGSCCLGISEPPVTIKNIECAIVDKAFEKGTDFFNLKISYITVPFWAYLFIY